MLCKWHPEICIRCNVELNLLFKLDHFLLFMPQSKSQMKQRSKHYNLLQVSQESKYECFDDLTTEKFLHIPENQQPKGKDWQCDYEVKVKWETGEDVCVIWWTKE